MESGLEQGDGAHIHDRSVTGSLCFSSFCLTMGRLVSCHAWSRHHYYLYVSEERTARTASPWELRGAGWEGGSWYGDGGRCCQAGAEKPSTPLPGWSSPCVAPIAYSVPSHAHCLLAETSSGALPHKECRIRRDGACSSNGTLLSSLARWLWCWFVVVSLKLTWTKDHLGPQSISCPPALEILMQSVCYGASCA